MNFSNNKSTDINSNTEGLSIPSIPKHRPIRKAYTVDATLKITSSKPQKRTTNVLEEAFDNGVKIPTVPLHRPVRRTTTDEINNLIRDTNEELQQMEKLVTKHTHARPSDISKTQDTSTNSFSPRVSSDLLNDFNKKSEPPVVPQRPHSNKSSSLSNVENNSQSTDVDRTKAMKGTETTSLLQLEFSAIDKESNNFDFDKEDYKLPQVPLKRPIKRQSSLEPNEPSMTNPFFDSKKNYCAIESVNIPVKLKEGPTEITKPIQFNKEDTDLIKEKNIMESADAETSLDFNNFSNTKELNNADNVKQDIQSFCQKNEQTNDGINSLVIKTEPNLKTEREISKNYDDKEIERTIDINDNCVAKNETVEIEETGDESDRYEKNNNNIQNNEIVGNIENTNDRTEPLSDVEDRDLLSQNIPSGNADIESSNVEEEKRAFEDEENEKSGVEPLINPTSSNLEKISSSISTAKESNKDRNSKSTEQNIVVESDLENNLEGGIIPKDNPEPLLEKEENVITDGNLKINEDNMNFFSDANKENSSEVLPTNISVSKVIPQVPLSRPQKRGPPPVPKKPSSKIAAFHEMLQKQQMKDFETQDIKLIKNEETGKQPPININFIDNLNKLVALPGMVPPNPNSISKVGNNEKMQDNDTVATNGKFESDKSTTKKELHDLRQRRSKGPRGRKLPSNVNNMTKIVVKNENYVVKVRHLWSLKCKINNFTAQTLENGSLVVTEDGRLNDQQSDVMDADSSKATKEHLPEDDLVMGSTIHAESRKLSNSTISLTDSILSRNDYNDEAILRKEKDFETTTEKQMQGHFIESDSAIADCINDSFATDSKTSTVGSLKPIVTSITEEGNINSN
ncbi:hypothetical protein RI543_004299 [Arxiozyma heterogenica]|uniref:Altered inheritance of mitochondria protein 21 n=1 Tax=Arxiozyma heterogenica TaxID=278026 RepID=A0AAN7WFD3_9SACH|nr:hypothetical protein RI543_004299 [Kazachstania heterogenica]